MMDLPQLFFVYDRTQGDFTTYLTKDEAQAAYDALIKQINDSVGGNDEYDGDEQVLMGMVLKRAEVVPVEMDQATGEEVFSLCSYALGGA